MKFLLCGYIETLYQYMFQKDIKINVIMNTDPKQHLNKHKLYNEKHVHVFMSPLPQDFILSYLFENHILKYDSYCHYVAKRYGFDENDFYSVKEHEDIETKMKETELKLKMKNKPNQEKERLTQQSN